MKPVYQTRFGDEGNCLQACLASLLELPLDEVPDANAIHRAGKDWRLEVCKWLKGCHRLWLVNLKTATPLRAGWELWLPPSYHLIGGTSPRGVEAGHCVIGYQGQMYFDPHPDNTGLKDVEEYTYLIRTFN